jgi:hypothetical protein
LRSAYLGLGSTGHAKFRKCRGPSTALRRIFRRENR